MGNVHLLAQLTIEERRLHVHVMDLPLELSGNGKEEHDRVQARDRSKDFIEINPRPLNVPLGDESGIVLEDAAVRVALELEDPLQSDGLVTCRQICQRPGLILRRPGFLPRLQLVE